MRGKRTGKVEIYAILFCPSCADPEDIQDYVQFESTPIHDMVTHAAAIRDARRVT